MAKKSEEYLTTKELADLLRIKERKVYDLAASGDIPCTRALGKLLFHRPAIDLWLDRHASGGTPPQPSPPSVICGSHDPLLEWAIRESGAGFATLFDGSLDGLDRLSRAEGVAAGLHVLDAEQQSWNLPLVTARFAGKPVVLVEWAWRQRGLIVAAGNPHQVGGIADLAGRRVAPRQGQAGSQLLLERMLHDGGLESGAVTLTRPARTETDAALAVLEGEADAALGLESVARQYRLDFVPLVRERFDLLVWRAEWFEAPFQALLNFCRSDAHQARAASLPGYDVSGFGTIHFNGR